MKDLFEEIAGFVSTLPWFTYISHKTKGALIHIECLNFLLVIDIIIHEEEKVLCINGAMPMDEPPEDSDLVKNLLEKNSPNKLDYLFEYDDELGSLVVHHHIDLRDESVRPSMELIQKVILDLKETLEKSYAPIAFNCKPIKHADISLEDYLDLDDAELPDNRN